MITDFEVIIRLVVSAIIGGMVGLERELNNRPAGLRTHIIVSVGSSLIMLVSKYAFSDLGFNSDPARLAAQVVSGIGFLGAGTIIMQGNIVHGLTTAASLWTTAAIGLSVGAGYYIGGIAATVIMMFTLIILRVFENSAFSKRYKVLNVIATERSGLIGEMGSIFAKYSIVIKHISLKHKKSIESQYINIEFVLKMIKGTDCNAVIEEINDISDVQSSFWSE